MPFWCRGRGLFIRLGGLCEEVTLIGLRKVRTKQADKTVPLGRRRKKRDTNTRAFNYLITTCTK